jgi:hypothetical protein
MQRNRGYKVPDDTAELKLMGLRRDIGIPDWVKWTLQTAIVTGGILIGVGVAKEKIDSTAIKFSEHCAVQLTKEAKFDAKLESVDEKLNRILGYLEAQKENRK